MHTVDELRAMLPKAGDKVVGTPTLGKSLGMEAPKPRAGVVIYVNEKNLWYVVQYDDGLRESYKLPEVRVTPNGRLRQ